MVTSFDENWYVNRYPDVAQAIAAGRFASPLSHYDLHGIKEGRRPAPDIKGTARVFAVGAYGTNNVGDEAIFDGLLTQHPGCIQLYLNVPRHELAVDAYSMLRGPNRFRPDDHLIIGGGGLLYHKDAIQTLIDLAKLARSAGARVDVLRIGCEAAQADYHGSIRSLVDQADTVSVRTTLSKQILDEIVGCRSTVEHDFALFLKKPVGTSLPSPEASPLIGLVTSGDPREDRRELIRVIKTFTGPHAPGGRVRFLHIPHSRAYLSPLNNDCVVGEILWSSIDVFAHSRRLLFSTASFTNDPVTVLNTYRDLDGVMSVRFHGLVFGKITGLPTLAMSAANPKTSSFVQDYTNQELFVSNSDGDLYETFGAFIEHVRHRKSSIEA